MVRTVKDVSGSQTSDRLKVWLELIEVDRDIAITGLQVKSFVVGVDK
jgi:hypothetical protein